MMAGMDHRHHEALHAIVADDSHPWGIRQLLKLALLVVSFSEVYLWAHALGCALGVQVPYWWSIWPAWVCSVALVRLSDWFFSRHWHPRSPRESVVRMTVNLGVGMVLSLPVVLLIMGCA